MTGKNKTTITVEPGKQDLTIMREFDAPCDLVYRAFIDPELFVQWLGPRSMRMTLETFEPKEGGRYRYIHTDSDGTAYTFRGVFHQVSPELLIQTFEYEGLGEPGHVSLESMKIDALPGGRTRVTVHSVYPSVADRDGMVQSGMEHGINEGYERLDALMEAVRKSEAVRK